MIQFFTSLAPTNQGIYLDKYMADIVNRSIDSLYGDNMQVFHSGVFYHNSEYYCYYTSNSKTDGDIDRVFLAKGPTLDSLVKVNTAGVPDFIIDAGAEGGSLPSVEVFGRHFYYDDELSLFRGYYTVRPTTFPTDLDYTAYATSSDGINWTKQGSVYSDPLRYVIYHTQWKNSNTDYVGITTTQEPSVAEFDHFYITSPDGVNWTNQGQVTISNTIKLVTYIHKQGGIYYLFCNAGFNDPHPPLGSEIVLYTTTDFVSFTLAGTLLDSFQPSERAMGGTSCLLNPTSGRMEIVYTYSMNYNKADGTGGEPFTEIRKATLRTNLLEIPTTTIIEYPSYVKKYWPLYHKDEGDLFTELIDGTATTHTPNSWDTLKFLDLLTDTLSFANTGLPSVSDLQLKMRVVIDLTATKLDLFMVGTDINVWLNAGLLHVSLNNNTKFYRSLNQIALPVGIGNPVSSNEVYIGFIFRNGTLTICNGNDTDYAKELIADGAMTDITDSQSNYVFGNSQIRSISLSTGMTDQQWIDLDL